MNFAFFYNKLMIYDVMDGYLWNKLMIYDSHDVMEYGYGWFSDENQQR